MIYLLALVLLAATWRYIQVFRARGFGSTMREIALTVVAGSLAGLGVAVGARTGMRLIAMANAAPPRISWSGTSLVFAVYIGIGMVCAVLYGAVFRRWLRGSGLAFGALLVLVTWYPLAHSGAQQLARPLSFAELALWSGAVVTLMWVPYACTLEWLLARWLGAPAASRAGGMPATKT